MSTIVIVLAGWFCLTLYVEQKGPAKQWKLGSATGRKALITYDPDPFYNLDEQVCLSFGKALAEQKMNVTIATVAMAETMQADTFAVRIYCANTYNWRPDWSITSFVRHSLTGRSDVTSAAITLGAGSTEASQNSFENVIVNAGGKLEASYSLWLWRPNDEKKMQEPNVEIAVAMAHDWGNELAEKIKRTK